MVFSGILAWLDIESVRQYSKTRVRWKDLLVKPLISALAMGVICAGVYLLVSYTTHRTVLALGLSIICAVASYFLILVNIGGVTEEDMDNLPMGRKLSYLKLKK